LNPNVSPKDAIAETQYVCNTTVHSSMKVSPYFAVYGRNPLNKLDLSVNPKTLPGSDFRYVEDIIRKYKNRFQTIEYANKLSGMVSKYKHDTSYIVGPPNLRTGDLVMCRANTHEKNLSRKFRIKQSGPFRIVAIHKNCALLADLEHNVLPDLKPFRALTKIDSYTENFPKDIVNNVNNETVSSDTQEPLNDTSVSSVLPMGDSNFYDVTPVEGLFTQSNKIKMRNNQKMTLIYPFGIKQSGTWVPTNFINN